MRTLFVFLFCFSGTFAFATPVQLDLTVVDVPFNTLESYYTFPSMRQSMGLSTAFYETAHKALAGEERSWKIWLVAGFDYFSMSMPLGSSWLHEEWHRAVMANRHIGSFNTVNAFPFGAGVIPVSHVQDDDLVRLKRDHPAEHVRMSSAGMEAQVAQNLMIARRHFFGRARTFDSIHLLQNAMSVSGYLYGCSNQKIADELTDKQNSQDGSDVPARDFTGADCTAWVYDLFRPDEPYAARGVHPSGVGIDRYIRYSDLSPGERAFLEMQPKLSLLNFVDPFFFGFNEFEGSYDGEPIAWNAKLSHTLTSFGYTADAHFFLRAREEQFLATLHNGFTDSRYFPGLTLEWIEHVLPWENYSVTGTMTLWPQPRAQRVDSTASEALVHGSATVFYAFSENQKLYAGLSGKTPGWLMGEVSLQRNVSLWSGVRFEFL